MTQASVIPDFRYRAFISYSHQDKSWAGWLHKALETYAIPKRLVGQTTAAGVIPKRLAPIFRDRDELASATDLGRKVNKALAQSANLIVICSPHSATSHWVNEEVLAFKRLGRSENIFCLIVDGEPNASELSGREAEECFANALRYLLGTNDALSSERTEPIAADARAGKDGKTNAKLKLIAGLLDLDFDALKRRELKRRYRRMAALATLALIVMALTTTLAVTAMIARHAAVVASQAAERRQKQAEDLVGFMLGDLNDKLEQVQRLDIMQAVDNKAMGYFESLPGTDVTPEAMAQRAKALEKIGAVRLDMGNLQGALEAYRASAAISSRLATAAPTDTARQLAYSNTLAFIGQAHWNQGKLEAAQQDFESARRVLRPLLEQASRDPALLRPLISIDDDLGHILEASGKPDAALALFQERLALDNKVASTHSGATLDAAQTEDTTDLGSAHNDLGKLALQRGDLATAIVEYRADAAIQSDLLARDPRNNEQRGNTLSTLAILGRTLALAGDTTTGIHDLQQSVDLATQLTAFDPRNADSADELALYSSQLARLQRLNGNLPAARALSDNAVKSLSVLASKDPGNEYGIDYSEALTEQAEESRTNGNLDAAREQARSALQKLETTLASHPEERDALLATMTAKLLLAAVTNDRRAARTLREQAWATMQAVKVDRGDPRLLALQVRALLAMGREVEAQPLLKRLWATGYREPGFVALAQREHITYPANPAFQQKIAQIMQKNASGALRSSGMGAN